MPKKSILDHIDFCTVQQRCFLLCPITKAQPIYWSVWMVFILEKHTFSRQSTRQDTRIAVIFLLPTRASMLSWVKKGRKNLQKQTKRYTPSEVRFLKFTASSLPVHYYLGQIEAWRKWLWDVNTHYWICKQQLPKNHFLINNFIYYLCVAANKQRA